MGTKHLGQGVSGRPTWTQQEQTSVSSNWLKILNLDDSRCSESKNNSWSPKNVQTFLLQETIAKNRCHVLEGQLLSIQSPNPLVYKFGQLLHAQQREWRLRTPVCCQQSAKVSIKLTRESVFQARLWALGRPYFASSLHYTRLFQWLPNHLCLFHVCHWDSTWCSLSSHSRHSNLTKNHYSWWRHQITTIILHYYWLLLNYLSCWSVPRWLMADL